MLDHDDPIFKPKHHLGEHREKTPEQFYVIDKILDGQVDDSGVHLYQVRWKDGEQTVEPINNLPRNLLIDFHKRQRSPLPETIDQSMQG